MDRIESLKRELADAVKESKEYKGYKELRMELCKQPNLKRAVDEFRKENFIYQNSVDIEDPLGAALALDERFVDIRNQDIVNRFLMAEMGLCRLVSGICTAVVDELDFDLEFLQ